MPAEPAAEPQRFFFVHMQKTGGVSLYMRMRRHFGDDAVYPSDSDGDPVSVAPQLMVPVLLERWTARRDQIRVVTGHFPLCTAELLDAEFAALTVLRHPVERTLSYLRHHRKTMQTDASITLEEIYEEPGNFKHFIQNHMVKMLSMKVAEMTDGMMSVISLDDTRLAAAREALDHMAIIGLQENLEGFAGQLAERFGWRLGPPVHENVTSPTGEVSRSFRRRIAEDNRLDVELYEHARSLAG